MNDKKINPQLVLVVDDEPDICELAEITLNRMGLQTQSANDISTAKKILLSDTFDLCLTDMNLPDGNGIDLVEHIQQNHPQTPVAVITAYGNMESAVRALKAGAFDFVSKPIDLQILRNLVTAAIALPSSTNATTEDSGQYRLLGDSDVIQQLRQKTNKLARSQAPVFIHGESGCGKELVAHLIHQQGARADKPFIPVNCGAIPSELMESEFFGHKKGSYTGATADKDGLFKAADGGTLFLDEVADLPLQMQVKLLRAIQEKAVRSVGDHHEESVDVRILSASHKDLSALVQQGKFREDLYYRINVIALDVPSLREHPEDIPTLINSLLLRIAKQSSSPTPELSTQAAQALANYQFPGNVRELENILERAIALADDNVIDIEDLQLPDHTSNNAADPITEQQAKSAPPLQPQAKDCAHNLSLIDQEKQAITQALEQTRWNKTAAAKLLGLSLRQLRYRLSKLDIE